MSGGKGQKGPGGKGRRGTNGPGRQSRTVRVHKAKGRPAASTRWLARQLNDPFVREAQRRGLRSRAAFKLEQLDARFHFLKPGARVIDLGAAPGGWSQWAASAVRAGLPGGGVVVAVDITPMDPLPGVTVLTADITDPTTETLIREALGGPADVVLSDMAPPATGHRPTDQLRIAALCDCAADIAGRLLAPGGALVMKTYQGGAPEALLASLKQAYGRVKHAKPAASRKESAEIYLVVQGKR